MGDASRQSGVSCVAGVLIGGASRRMGRPKALLSGPGGETLVEHAVGVARMVTDEVVLLGSLDGLPGGVASIRRLPDSVPGAGPLAGLCSLLAHAGERWGLLLACDMPRLDAAVLERLVAGARPEVDVVVFERAEAAGTYHACCALYHPRTLPAVEAAMRSGNLGMQRFLGGLRVVALRPSVEEAAALANVNTPADYEQFLRARGYRRPNPVR